MDGDYAFPKVRYAVVEGASNLVHEQLVHVSGTDQISTSTNVPSAKVSMTKSVSVPNSGSHAALLGGVTFDIRCIDNATAGCPICNSNGAWFTDFAIGLQNCTGSTCIFNATFERGWTPSHGGGKPLSSCLHFNITAQILSVATEQAWFDEYAYRASLFAPPANATRAINLPATAINRMLSGVRRFEFSLQGPAKYPNRGRYFERIVFGVTQPRLTSPSAAQRPVPRSKLHGVGGSDGGDKQVVYEAGFALSSPQVTTYPTDVLYRLDTAVVVLANGPAHVTRDSRVVQGVACEDDAISAFRCSAHGLPASLTSHVTADYPCSF